MLEQARGRGRPRVENKKSNAEKQKAYRARLNKGNGKQVSFNLDPVSLQSLEQLMEENGYEKKEQSEFLCALLLQLTGKKYYGRKLVIQEKLENHSGTGSACAIC